MSNKIILPILILTYITCYVSANWLDSRLVKIMWLITGGGALIFPMTYLLSSLITEVYGYKYSRLSIWIGFMYNIMFMLYGLLITYMPYPKNIRVIAEMFDRIQQVNARIIIASIISYLIAEPLNSFITAKLKILFQGKLTTIRFLMTTIIANFTGTLSFCILGFYGIIPNQKIIYFIISSYLIMVSIEIILTPISASLAKKLKNIEKLDIYDNNTKFNIFSLDTKYTTDSNRFKVESK